MQSKDLRVGNYVWNDLPFGSREIHEIKVYDFGCQIMRDAEPIELNEEWLLNFGFSDITLLLKTKTRNIKQYCKSYFVEKCVEQQTIFITVGSLGWTFKSVGAPSYNYVHQLQNLYFALTGEELELKNESKP